MKENQEPWIAALRRALRDEELPLPEGGWERLARDLERQPAAPARRMIPLWVRVAGVAAVVALACVSGYRVMERAARLEPAAVPASWRADIPLPGGDPAAERSPEIGSAEDAAGSGAASASLLAQAPPAAGRERRTEREGSDASPFVVSMPEPATECNLPLEASDPARAAAARERTGSQERSATHRPVDPQRPESGSDGAQRPADRREDPSAQAEASDPRRTRSQAETAQRPASSASRPADFAGEGERPFVAARTRRGVAVGLFASGMPATGGHTGQIVRPASYLLQNAVGVTRLTDDYDNYIYSHRQTLGVGFSVRKALGRGFSVESGVNYTLLLSDVRTVASSDSFTQKLHMIGIPLRVNWNFLESRRVVLYIGAGGMVEKCVAARFGGHSVSEPGVQWSLHGIAGVQCNLGRHTALYFEPGVAGYLTDTRLRTVRTDSPVNLTLNLGFRLRY